MEDLYQLFQQFKAEHNIIVAHCYGVVHTLRLLKRLKNEGRRGEIAGVVLLSLGKKKPVSMGLIGKLPAFALGETSYQMLYKKNLFTITGFVSPLHSYRIGSYIHQEYIISYQVYTFISTKFL